MGSRESTNKKLNLAGSSVEIKKNPDRTWSSLINMFEKVFELVGNT